MKKLSIILSILFLTTIANAQTDSTHCLKFKVGLSLSVDRTQFKLENSISQIYVLPATTFAPSLLIGLDIKHLSIVSGVMHNFKDYVATGGVNGVDEHVSYEFYSIPLKLSFNFLPSSWRIKGGIIAEGRDGLLMTFSQAQYVQDYSDRKDYDYKHNFSGGGGLFASVDIINHLNIGLSSEYLIDFKSIDKVGSNNKFNTLSTSLAAFFVF